MDLSARRTPGASSHDLKGGRVPIWRLLTSQGEPAEEGEFSTGAAVFPLRKHGPETYSLRMPSGLSAGITPAKNLMCPCLLWRAVCL